MFNKLRFITDLIHTYFQYSNSHQYVCSILSPGSLVYISSQLFSWTLLSLSNLIGRKRQ